MLHHIRLSTLVIGIIIGVVGILFIDPEGVVTYKYPTPELAKEIVYKDRNGVCYQYVPKEVDCDKNESRLKPFPLSR